MQPQMIQRILYKVEAIPSLPAAVQRLGQLAQDPEANESDLIQVISSDEVLTSRILRAANSPFYGLSQRISTVSHAIVVLGLQTIRNLALGVSVFGARMGADHAHSLHRDDLWRHALTVATTARQVSRLLGDPDPELVFTAGLLHDIGQVVLIEFFSPEYTPVLEQAALGDLPLHVLEERALGIHHAAVGVEICRHWKLPPAVGQIVSRHHQSLQRSGPLSAEDRRVVAVQVADNLARIAQIGSDGEPGVQPDFLSVLDTEEILPAQLRQLLLTLPEEVRKAEVFFDIAASSTPAKSDHGPLDRAGVFLADRREREIVRLVLLSLGYTLVPIEEMRSQNGPLAGVVADDSLPPDLIQLLQQNGTPLLDFAAWRGGSSAANKPAQINIPHLQQWLADNLPPAPAADP